MCLWWCASRIYRKYRRKPNYDHDFNYKCTKTEQILSVSIGGVNCVTGSKFQQLLFRNGTVCETGYYITMLCVRLQWMGRMCCTTTTGWRCSVWTLCASQGKFKCQLLASCRIRWVEDNFGFVTRWSSKCDNLLCRLLKPVSPKSQNRM